MFVYVCIIIHKTFGGSLVSVGVGSWCGMVKVPGSKPPMCTEELCAKGVASFVVLGRGGGG
jgi:hypothetical protein